MAVIPRSRPGPGADVLRLDVSPRELTRRTVGGSVSIAAAQAITFAIQFTAAAVFARLLQPADVGLVAMVTSVTGVVFLISDLGLSMATIQSNTLTESQASNLFWCNVVIGLALMGMVAGASPLLSSWYREPRLAAIGFALSFLFLLSGLAYQHLALLRRQLRFAAVAVAQTVGVLVGSAVGVAAAWQGAGYWALVAAVLMRQLVTTAAAWTLCPFKPGLPSRNAGTLNMVRFGADVVGFDVVNYAARNLDNVLIGRVWGAAPLGIYAKAYEMLLLPISQLRGPIAGVALPAMSRARDDGARFAAWYLTLVEVTTLAGMPFVLWMVWARRELVDLVLGPRWEPVAAVFLRLGLAGALQLVVGTLGTLLVAYGLSRRYLKWGCAHAGVMVVSFLVGLPYGPLGVSTSYLVANVLVAVPSVLYCTRGTPVRASAVARTVWPAVVWTAAAYLGASASAWLAQEAGADRVGGTVLGSAAFAAVYATQLLAAPRRAKLFSIARTIRAAVR